MNDLIVEQGTQIVPRLGAASPILLELKATKTAEERLSDISVINSAIAPGLVSDFTKGLSELNKALGVIDYELIKIKDALRRKKAYLLVDYIPKFILDRKMKDTDKQREAILDLDNEYLELQTLEETYEGVKTNLKGRFESLKHALFGLNTLTKFKQESSFGSSDDYSDADFGPGQTIRKR